MRCDCSPADPHAKSIKVEVAFDPDSLHLRDTIFGTQIELNGAKPGGEIGGPALPRFVVKVAVPQLQWPTRMQVSHEHFVQVTRQPVFVAPVQPLHPGAMPAEKVPEHDEPAETARPEIKWSCFRKDHDSDRSQFPEPFPAPVAVPPDAQIYEKSIRAPRPLARPLSIETIGLTRIARIEINPVRQNAAGQLELCTRCEIELTYSEERPLADKETALKHLQAKLGREVDPNRLMPQPEPVVTSRLQARKLAELARSEVVNAELITDLDRYWPYLEMPADYLIITDNKSWDAETITPGAAIPGLVEAFQKLATWKRSRGVTTKLVTITDIVAGRYGDFRSGSRDLQEVIRKFLKRAVPDWGVSWLLLGGDVGVVPIRKVAGAIEGHIGVGTDNPPKENQSFWTGGHLKMNVVNPGTWWSGLSTSSILVNPANGQLIPYDPAGTSDAAHPGWYFTTSKFVITDLIDTDRISPHLMAGEEASPGVLDPYAVPSGSAGTHVRVNGPAWLVNTTLQWLYTWNTIPTDMYYSSLASYILAEYEIEGPFGFDFSIPYVWFPEHDWDAANNGLYGQHNNSGDLDGVVATTDISVGRAPVDSAAQAEAFVKKVIAYESFRSPDNGLRLDGNWPRRVVLASSNWGGAAAAASATASNPPEDDRYHHATGSQHSLIKLSQPMWATGLALVAEISATDRRIIPYGEFAGDGGRGWHFAKSATDLSVSEMVIPMPWGATFRFPMPSQWVAVFGPAAELTPLQYLLVDPAQDGSMSDQEQLRVQLQSELPKWDSYTRLYEDDLDLTPAQAAAAPVQHLTTARLQASLNAKPHILSLSGHGSSNGCCGGSPGMASALTNGYETFIGYADSCLTNQVDAMDAFSEALVYNPNGGAVAYVGNTRFSWIGVGDNFQRAFFHRLTAVDHLGLLNDSRCSLLGTTGYQTVYERWAIFALNLMGDPEMRVKKRPSRFLDVYVGDRVVAELKRRAIRIKVVEVGPPKPVPPDPQPVADVLVHIRQGEASFTARTDRNGEAQFDLTTLATGEAVLTVSHDEFAPHQISTRIAGPDWARGVVTEISHRADGTSSSLIHLRGEDGERRYHASADSADYRLILDAAENAFLSQQPISFWVDSVDDGGVIERFRFARPN